jgi:signal transduction histidine kinase
MTFRVRMLVALGSVALAPLGALAIGVRHEMDRRLTASESARIAALESLTRESLSRESERIVERLRSLADALANDNRFRLAALEHAGADRRYVLDWGERAMRLTGLSMLQLQDERGRILSSGHFRDEFDRLDPELPALVRQGPEGARLIRARTPDGEIVALARIDSVRVGGRRFTLVGGVTVDSAFLARLSADTSLRVAIDPPAARAADVTPIVTSTSTELATLQAGVDRWFTGALALVVAAVVLGSLWLAARMSRPLAALAAQSAHVNLDRLDTDFSSERDDEIGDLARLLGKMTRRLRTSAAHLREAERRATIGDVARQVNHDLRNGLAPIRHVLRNLGQVERDEPAQLARVFAERRQTLTASVEYLDTLARRYAQVGARAQPTSCDVNAIAREAAAVAASHNGTSLRLDLAPALPRITTDPLSVRRIIDNLVSNAADAVRDTHGTITIATTPRGEQAVCLTIEDDGPGMSDAELASALHDFHTTKPHGTGLGLSIVRRLAADLGWTLRIQSAPGTGTRVTLDSPSP